MEAWLRGPIDGMPPLLMPAAHALVQAREDVHGAAAGLMPSELWLRPGGAASIGFHLRHMVGSLDRLLTYARGESLDETQLAGIPREGEPGDPATPVGELLAAVDRGVEGALGALRSVSDDELLTPREIGRARLPSTLLGVLFHAAEHTQRHAGQVITTAKIVRGLELEAGT